MKKGIHFSTCKFCGERFNSNLEGVTYKDGTEAHEDCHDANEFEKENADDLVMD